MYNGTGNIMDAKDWASMADKIAQKLIQFHSKLPDNGDLVDFGAKMKVRMIKETIALLLERIDEMANSDERGWIK